MMKDRTFKIIKPIFKVLLTGIFFMKVNGKENIPKEGGFIICSNHRSNLDPIFLSASMPKLPHFMAKDELFKIPILKSLIKWGKAFPIKRGKSDISAIDIAIKIVEDKEILLMFPEGTRSKTGELLKPKSGVAFIASHSGGDVLPCSIKFKGKLFPFKRVYVSFGEIIKNDEIKIIDKSSSSLRTASKLIMDKIGKLLEK